MTQFAISCDAEGGDETLNLSFNHRLIFDFSVCRAVPQKRKVCGWVKNIE